MPKSASLQAALEAFELYANLSDPRIDMLILEERYITFIHLTFSIFQ